MTRDNTSYREKGRAVFLATIMVVSVVGMSAAFAGSAAAVQPIEQTGGDDFNQPGSGNDNFEKLSNSIRYAGQSFNISFDAASLGDATWQNEDEIYLAEVAGRNDNDDSVNSFGSVSSIENTSSTSGVMIAEVDLEGVDSGEYVIANKSTAAAAGISTAFSVQTDNLGVSFDDSDVDGTDNSSLIELTGDRALPSSHDVTVRVTGPDGNALDADAVKQIFDMQNGAASNPAGTEDANVVTDIADTPANFLDDYDIDDDSVTDLEDDGYVTIDLDGSDYGDTDDVFGDAILNGNDEFRANFTNLAAGEGLPDDGEYEFEFIAADTGATATGTLNIGESNEDADFSEGTVQAAAGDIAEFSVELTDTDETYVQIGGDSSDFVEVLRLVADDESEPMTVRVNTRLLGSPNEDVGAVYDTDNVDTIESGVHGKAANNDQLESPADVDLFEDDGDLGAPDADSFDSYVEDIGIADAQSSNEKQLTRPMQSTDYEIIAAGVRDVDTAVFDADPGGAANDQLDSAVLELQQPEIGDITVHTAPEEDADDTADVEELVNAATPRQEVALDDQLVVQVEATGIYGALVAGGNQRGYDWDRLDEGVITPVMYDLDEGNGFNESITFEVAAESTTGNQDPLEIQLDSDSSDSDSYIVLDNDGGQFFLIADTSSDTAFENGDAPDSETDFTATLEYDADNDDNRYEFEGPNTRNDDAFDVRSGSYTNYPYLLQGETLSASADLTLAPRSMEFDNQNADELVQAQASEDAEISGTTNVAPGSDAEIRISSTDASSSFRLGNDVNITEDGSVSTTYDISDQEVGDEFGIDFRVGGSSADTADGVVVEAIGDSGDSEETNETDTDDGEDMDDGETEPADDGESESTDDGESESTDDGTPGFGAVVALIALIGAALLAVRRQN